jgi:hypothetical protein
MGAKTSMITKKHVRAFAIFVSFALIARDP